MFKELRLQGFQVEFSSHARAIVKVDFPKVAKELESALLESKIPIQEIIASGGGEAKGTQRLRRALDLLKWKKTTFDVEKTINGERSQSQSHEIDHVREFVREGKTERIALEIEWNNKDPFFDRDLENFKRLHADGAISVGIIVTRGKSLQDNMRALVDEFLDKNDINDLSALTGWGYEPTSRQKQAIAAKINRTKNPLTFREAFIKKFVSDKFGEATTHWRKLDERIRRGVGNPCPLILIGLPSSIVTFGEKSFALREGPQEFLTENSD